MPMTGRPGTASRHRAWRFGRLAEALCALSLWLRGYRILARDLRTPVGELDIVARRGRVLAIIEVKARTGDGDPIPTARQRRRIADGARAFLSMRPHCADLDVRFDLMEVRPWRWPRHHADAWRPGD
jgi:putative endonuclease